MNDRRTPLRARSTKLLIVSFIAAALLGGCAGLAVAPGETLPTDSPAAAASQHATPRVSASPGGAAGSPLVAAPAYTRWNAATIDVPGGGGGSIVDVVRFHDHFYVFGNVGSDPQPFVWTSVDGASWAAGPALPVSGPRFMWTAAATGDRIVAMADGGPEDTGLAYVSTDGRTWTTADTPGLMTLTALPDRFVGVLRGRDQFSVWTSIDGSDWRKVANGRELGGGNLVRIRAVPAGDRWIVIGVGVRDTPDGYGAAMWVATDAEARDWQPIELPNGSSVGLGDVAGSGDRLVAVGTAGYCCRVSAWTSANGLDWTSIGDPVGEGGMSPSTIAWTPSGFLVAGIHAVTEESGDFRGWVTLDGATWNQIPGDPIGLGQSMLSGMQLLVRDDAVVIATASVRSGASSADVPLAWLASP